MDSDRGPIRTLNQAEPEPTTHPAGLDEAATPASGGMTPPAMTPPEAVPPDTTRFGTTPPPETAPPVSPPPTRQRGRAGFWVPAAVIVVAGLVAGGFALGRWVANDVPAAQAPVAGSAATNTPTALADGDEPVADVAAALAPSVVQIEADQGLGSGIIYTSDGYILTAAHVVGNARSVDIRLSNGDQVTGTVVGVDNNTDVGVVKIDRPGLSAAPLATGQELRLGQLAIAIGSPFGLDQTVTSGVVSSVSRAIPGPDGVVRAMIQTDTPINPGNSGGALADRSGMVIGINDSIFSQSGGNIGVGFAIPIDTAKSVADRLIAGEPIRTALLGVTGTDPTSGQAGALITAVSSGTAADSAEIQVGDLITSYDGKAIESFTDLAGAVRTSQPGDTVTLGIVRGTNQLTIQVTLGEASQ